MKKIIFPLGGLILSLVLIACGPSGGGSDSTTTNTGGGTTPTPGTISNVKFTTTIDTNTANPWKVTLDASNSTRGDNYQWSIKDTTNTEKTTASGMITSVTLAAGSYTIYLTVKDAAGNTGTASSPLQIGPTEAIIVDFKITDQEGKEPNKAPINLIADATASTLGVTYSWSIKDNAGAEIQTASGRKTLLAILNRGTYLVELTITDSTGQSNKGTQSITLEQAPPLNAIFTATQQPNSYEISVDATQSTNAIGYEWEVKDQTDKSVLSGITGAKTNLPLSSSGLYTLILKITDSSGNTAISQQYFNVQENNSLTASIAALPTSGAAPLTVLFDGSGSKSLTDSSITNFAWAAVDSSGNTITSANGQSVTLIFPGVGVYVVTLTITDATGSTATTTEQINVTPEIASTTGSNVEFTVKPLSSAKKNTLLLDANPSHMNNPITQYLWSASLAGTEVGTATGTVTTMGIENSGTYRITLTITDSTGATLTGSQIVTIP